MMNASQSWIWNGSAFVPCGGIPASDRGFRYGMAVFESLAIRKGRIEFLEAHLIRLQAACRRCGWPIDPVAFTRIEEAFGQIAGPAFARIYITAGPGAPTAPVTSPRIVLLVEPRNASPEEPIRLAMHPEAVIPILGGTKTANYWTNIMALQTARTADSDEALLFNPCGELISACMANVFVELNGQWITPPVTIGARAGVVREWVMKRRDIVEHSISREEVQRSSACFLTSCWAGVTPVATFEGRKLSTAAAELLRAEFFSAEN